MAARRVTADHELRIGGECRLFGATCERAHGHIGAQKLIDYQAPHSARDAEDENWV